MRRRRWASRRSKPRDTDALPSRVDDIRREIESVTHWYHRIELAPGVVTPGINDSAALLASLPLPKRADGLRVLDVGTRDGFFAFEMERRGADVTAIDYMPIERTGFAVAKRLLGSEVEYVNANVYDLTHSRFGHFDLVLLLGLLYHLRDPLLALDRVWDVCSGEVIVETQVIDNALQLADGSVTSLEEVDERLSSLPLMQFYPGDRLGGDPTNWWAPNAVCLQAMMHASGFHVDSLMTQGQRAVASGTRTQDPHAMYHRDIEKRSPAG